MADPTRQWLTTGGVARLCSVKPDTVQKWIRKGRISAHRTAGGHYRIGLSDIEPFLTESAEPRWFARPPAVCHPQPLRCWEYMSDNGVTRDECKNCVVYRVRAAWCFEVLGIGQGVGHGRQFCRDQTSCQDCVYFRRVSGSSVPILVITADETLVLRLNEPHDPTLSLIFASSAYEASALIGSSRPVLVIVDEDLSERTEPGLLAHLLGEKRVPGLRIAVCGPRGSTRRHAKDPMFPRLEKPFDHADICALLDLIPVERQSAEPA